MTYEKIFSDIQKNFNKAKLSDFTREFAFQFNITGEGEGIFYAAYKNGVLSIEPYDYKDRDVIFTADGKTLIAIAAGKLEPIDAINDGKLSVDGNQELAKELMLLINRDKKAETKTAVKPAAKKEAEPAAKEVKEVKKEEKAEAKTEANQEQKLVASKSEEKTAAAVPETIKPEEKKTAAPAALNPEEKKTTAAPKTTSKAPAKAKSKKGRRK